MQTEKDRALEAIKKMPDDAGIEDAIARLYLLFKIQNGIRQADDGRTITQKEAREQMARWLK